MADRPSDAIDCDCCDATGRYPVYGSGGKLHLWIECPVCCGSGHDFGEAAEIEAEKAEAQTEAALLVKYQNAIAEMRAANG